MSKIVAYLNEHLVGEIINSGPELAKASADGSVLFQRPEMVIHVANTSDIRKVARFCWQLAEKGHVLPITARGGGTDMTGAATGSGIVISPVKYMSRVVGIDPNQKLIHVQAGASYRGVNMALSTHKGLSLPGESFYGVSGTVGGAISAGAVGHLNSRYGSIGDMVTQLEVVLASGDVLQTGRLSKRELSAKKGLQTLEGEIYRQIDNLITDNIDTIRGIISKQARDTSGYANIAKVKRKDGSLDLTPLFVGSQGTLGIITEAIVKAQFARRELSAVLASYSDMTDALVAADRAVALKAVSVEIIDGRLLKRVAEQGKKRDFAPEESFAGALVIAIYDDFGEKARNRAAKKLHQQLVKSNNTVHLSVKKYTPEDVADTRSLLAVATNQTDGSKVTPSLFSGLWLPEGQVDNFLIAVKKLESEHDIELPVYVDLRSGFVDVLPVIDVAKVIDRQKIIKLLAAMADVIGKLGGSLSGYGGDGRIKSAVSSKVVSEEVATIYEQVKKIFDPYSLLNPGVKQQTPAKDLVAQLNDWSRFVISTSK